MLKRQLNKLLNRLLSPPHPFAIAVFLAPLASMFLFISSVAQADKLCGDRGVWVQILGAGGPEIDDRRAGSSFLVWHDGAAKVMIDTGPGASVAFDKAEADFVDLDAIAFTHLHTDHSVDLPSFIKGSYFLDRKRPLIVLGPDSNNPDYPAIETFLERLIGPEGAFAYLRDFLTAKSSGGYRISVRTVPATGKKRWARYSNETVKLAAIPVNHADVPALAWRVEIAGMAVVFTGDFNNQKNVIGEFAAGADALVATHAIHEKARGNQRELHALPSQLGKISAQADVRMLVLAHRMNRTNGRESQTRRNIEEHYSGHILFADDMECWGL